MHRFTGGIRIEATNAATSNDLNKVRPKSSLKEGGGGRTVAKVVAGISAISAITSFSLSSENTTAIRFPMKLSRCGSVAKNGVSKSLHVRDDKKDQSIPKQQSDNWALFRDALCWAV
jgi:hypothetical protein